MSNSVWEGACRLVARHIGQRQRLDFLLEELPAGLSAVERRRVRHLVYGVMRHMALLEHAVAAHVQRLPRPLLRAALLLGAFELLQEPGSAPVIVHHAVGAARGMVSSGEARLINAVLRRIPATLQTVTERQLDNAGPDALALRYSHPDWLVERWLAHFGREATLRLLEWNQQPAPVYARVLPEAPAGGAAEPAPAQPLPEWFRSTRWPGFFLLDSPQWAEVERLLAAGRIYLQNPGTALAPDLLGVRPGETVLDVCAAPGGKTLALATATGAAGRVVAVDLPGPRLERLRENLARHPDLPVAVHAADATKLTAGGLQAAGLPGNYDAVLVDVPCTNTGVLRHRVDAKWRLRPADLDELPELQGAILRSAAALVRPGGRLVYSTCSLEPEENEAVVESFVGSDDRFSIAEVRHSRPWESDCDGAGAFRLTRREGET